MGLDQPGTAADFEKVIADAGSKTVFVDFTATWCGPCKRIGPEFEKLAGENSEAVFIKVDVDENEAVAAKFGIQAMPTFIAIKEGKKVGEMVGADPAKLAELVSSNK